MKVLLINIDSVIPNLALHKIAKYHSDRGDEVIWDFPLLASQCGKTYVACVFSKNRNSVAATWDGIAEIGGSCWDLNTELPPEIESQKPRINLGFTMRGCVRKCDFCIVHKKEGKARPRQQRSRGTRSTDYWGRCRLLLHKLPRVVVEQVFDLTVREAEAHGRDLVAA